MRQFGIFIPAFLLAFIVLSGGRAQAIGESGLIAYWSFNGCDFTDDSGNGHHGFAGEGLPGCVAGPNGFGMAYEFDGGSDGSMDSIRFPGVRVSADQHSYALWFSPAENLDAASPRQDLLYRDISDITEVFAQKGRPHITLNHDGDGKLGFHARIQKPDGALDDYNAYNDIKSSTATWQAGRWYHIAVTWDGSQFRVYVDGELQQSKTKPYGLSYVYEGVVVGMRGSIDFPFRGRIDEVRMYDYALMPSQIQALAQRPDDKVDTGTIMITKLTEPAGVSASFPFTLGDGTTERDFELKDGASAIFEQIPVGAYVAQEESLAGFSLRDITCVEDGVANSVVEVENRQALINLEPGETVMCTFTNGLDSVLNLIPWVDSAVQSVSRWDLSSGSFLPTESRQNDGSGSISLSGTTIVKGPAVSVTAGEVYTCGVYYQGDAMPTTLRVRLKVWGDKKREASGAKNWLFTTPGEWGLATFVFEAQPGDETIRLVLARPRKPANRYVPMRVDDAFCVTGLYTPGG